MVSIGTNVTKTSVVNEFLTRVKNPAYNSAVFWNTSNPGSTRINVSQLGSRDVSAPSTSNIPDLIVTASTILNVFKSYAKVTTVYRRARSGLITDSGTTDDRTDVCRLIDGYQITYTYGNATVGPNNTITASSMNNFMQGLRNTASAAQSSAGVVDLRVCHSSCHSSCHGSRGRR